MILRKLPHRSSLVFACVLWLGFPLLLAGQGQPASVPQQLTLDEAMRLALKQNPTLLREEQNLAIAAPRACSVGRDGCVSVRCCSLPRPSRAGRTRSPPAERL